MAGFKVGGILKRLNLPDGEFTKSLRAIQELLRNDPTLKSGQIRNFRFWDGTVGESEDPVDSKLPWVSVGGAGGAGQWESEGLHGFRFSVAIDLVVAGTDEADFWNLWSAVIVSLFPRHSDTRRFEQRERLASQARIYQLTLAQVPDPVHAIDRISGRGIVEVLLEVSTGE